MSDALLLGQYFDPSGKTSLNVYSIAYRFLEVHRLVTARTTGANPIWRYVEELGIWKPDGEDFIRKEVDRVASQHTNSHLLNEVISSIRAKAYIPDLKLGSTTQTLVVKNGLLDLETGKLRKKFEPSEYHITRLEVAYGPKAKCPNFLKFLDEVTQSPADKEAIIEFIGYTLFKQYVYEIIMLLVGEGANGKSILLSLLKDFLGSDNVSSVTPQQLEKSRFASAQLFGKLACIAGDIPSMPLQYTGVLKMLTGGDLIHAEHKNRDPFDFMNYAKLIFSANQVPESWDSSSAFYRRFRIIDFPNQFTPDSENYMPRDKLLALLKTDTEKSGLLNIAIAGLKKLRSQGQLTGESSIAEKRLDYIRRSDPANYFFERFLYHNTEAPIFTKAGLYSLYVQFCHTIEKVPLADQTFGKKVKRLVSYAGESRPRESDQRITVWTGIGFNQAEFDKEMAGHSGHRIFSNPDSQELLSNE